MWTVTIDFTKAIDSHYTQINLESTQIFWYQTRLHQLPEEELQRSESIFTGRRRKQHVRDQARNQTGRLAFQHGSTEFTKRRHPALAKGDNDHECFTNLSVADDVLLFASSKEQFQKILGEFKRSIEKWVSGFTQKKTYNLSNQSGLSSDTHGNANDMLRTWIMGAHQRTRKNDTIDEEQNAPTHRTKKRRYKKIVIHKVNTSEEIDNND